MNYTIVFVVFTLLTFILTVYFLKRLIPVLASKHIGQKILDIGPRWHKNKEGTPTMGGISFIISGLLCFLVYAIVFFPRMDRQNFLISINIMVYGLLNGMIGMIDDVAKMRKNRNEGLTPFMKFLLQSVFCFVFLITMSMTVGINTVLTIPFFNFSLDLGFAYYGLLYVFLIGIVNSVNLTDGIDGLASIITFTIGLFLVCCSVFISGNYPLSFISALLIGSSLGFLTYNFYPAKVFMGDTGSLYFGGIIASTVFLTGNIIIALIYNTVFVIEAFSDILQVAYFKISKGKRLFKIAPLHHHFEKCGWSEVKIVSVFAVVNSIFCIIAFLGLLV
ncbi:MAG: phospho-N-acetylmuramoyl-pentapeptide-transferase [Clostridia bacterium]|nr:phospho-N-acetylmuramoyl-pentapeptide-transferase [Clostridia bacterium]